MPVNTTPTSRVLPRTDSASERLLCLVACPLLLLTPFAVFLKYHDDSLLRPEVLAAAAVLVVAATPLGVLTAIAPSFARGMARPNRRVPKFGSPLDRRRASPERSGLVPHRTSPPEPDPS